MDSRVVFAMIIIFIMIIGVFVTVRAAQISGKSREKFPSSNMNKCIKDCYAKINKCYYKACRLIKIPDNRQTSAKQCAYRYDAAKCIQKCRSKEKFPSPDLKACYAKCDAVYDKCYDESNCGSKTGRDKNWCGVRCNAPYHNCMVSCGWRPPGNSAGPTP